jgi:hypothetical protein
MHQIMHLEQGLHPVNADVPAPNAVPTPTPTITSIKLIISSPTNVVFSVRIISNEFDTSSSSISGIDVLSVLWTVINASLFLRNLVVLFQVYQQ